MMIGMWVIAFAMAVMLVNRSLERSRNPNNHVLTAVDGGKRSITLQQSRYGHYVVTGRINGHAIDFLVDTGATSVSIPDDFARRINLRRGTPITIDTANGLSTAYATRVDSLGIGELEIRNATAHINPGLSNEALLGMSVLKHFELVQRGNVLIIREP